MNVPLVDLKVQYENIKTEIDSAMLRVVNNTSFIMGKEVSDFEHAFASYVGAKQAVGVASGTAALQLALLACGVGPGDEVITTAHTFIATAEAILHTGATPVFVDIDAQTYNMDVSRLEEAITQRTKAIIPVHLYGQPVEMDDLLFLARKHNLYVIEDAAQAHGAEYKGRRCGTMGHLGCFSFYPGKNLGAYGDGGAVTGNEEILVERVRLLRNHGRSTKYKHDVIGFGERLDALQAAILGAKLPYLEEWTEARRSHAGRYDAMLADLDVETPTVLSYVRHVFHLYVIKVPDRDRVIDYLRAKGVGAGIHYPIPLHWQPAFVDLGYKDFTLPVTERISGQILSLPLYPELPDDQLDYVVSTLKNALIDSDRGVF